MGLHKNLAGDDLHDPKGKFPSPLEIDKNTAQAYRIYEDGTSDAYLVIDTTTGTEEVTFGNATTNPKCTVAGTGLFTTGGGQKVAMATLTGPLGPDLNASHYVSLVNTTAGAVTINLVTPSTVANQTFVFIDSHSQFGTHNLILARAASENIDNVGSNKTISTNNARLTLFCDGTNWFTVIDTSSATSGIAAVVDDTTPQLGGNLDCNGHNVIIDHDNSILDENTKAQVTFLTTSSALNSFGIRNAATGGEATADPSTAPTLEAIGETHVDLGLLAKGTGTVTIRGNTNSGTLTLNAESNTKYVNIKPPLNDDLTSYTLTLPGDDGDADQVLKTDGSGNLDWVDQASGGGGYTVEAKSANFTAAVDYYYVIDSSGGTVTVALPNASSNSGKQIGFKARHGATHAVTLDRSAGGTIDGVSSNLIISASMASVEIISDGTNWWIL